MITSIPGIKYALLGAFVLGCIAGWQVNGWRCQAGRAAGLEAALDARIEDEAAANRHSALAEVELAGITKDDLALRRSLFDETRQDAYRCPVPADGMRLFNAARTGRGAPGKPDRPVR